MHTNRKKTITFTYTKFLALKKRYLEAMKSQELSFEFEGIEFVTLFAKFLLKSLETVYPTKAARQRKGKTKCLE